MGLANSSLTEKLAEMDSTIHSSTQKMAYQAAWRIADFHQLVKCYDKNETLVSKQLTIPILGGPNEAAFLIMKCSPHVFLFKPLEPQNTLEVSISADLTFSNEKSDWKGTLSVGLLNQHGLEHCVETVNARSTKENTAHLSWSRDKVFDLLQPDGSLAIFCRVELFTWKSVVMFQSGPSMDEQHKGLLADNLCTTMLDNFVDLGASSVLLVFQDGQQLCHTFPLAARNDSWNG
jgi:hypothetical protein